MELIISPPAALMKLAWLYFLLLLFFLSSPEDIFPLLLRGKGKEKGRERNINVREKLQLVVSQACLDQGPSHLLPRHVP